MLKRNWKSGLVTLSVFAFVALYLWLKSYGYSLILALLFVHLVLFAFRPDYQETFELDRPFIDNPLEVVFFTDTHVKVMGELMELDKIKKVVLELQDGKGSLQFPYNHGGKICFHFPAKYLYQLKQQFSQYLPDVEYIS